MHVRIAWEIYHHQQKQPSPPSSNGLVQQGKSSNVSSTPLTNSTSTSTSALSQQKCNNQIGSGGGSGSRPLQSDILRPLNNLFSMSFSSSLLSAAAGHTPPRPPIDTIQLSAHHAAQSYRPLVGHHPHARPAYPNFHGFNPLTGMPMTMPHTLSEPPAAFYGQGAGSRELMAGHRGPPGWHFPSLSGLDPWMRGTGGVRSSPSLTYPSLTPPASSNANINATGWGGLKAEAERDRYLGHLESESDKQRKEEAKRLKMKSSVDNRNGDHPHLHPHPPVGHPFGPGGPGDPSNALKAFWGFLPPPGQHPHDPFKSMHDFASRPDLEREHLFNRYNILNSSGGGAPLTEKLAKESPAHNMLSEKEKEQFLEKHKMMAASSMRSKMQ